MNKLMPHKNNSEKPTYEVRSKIYDDKDFITMEFLVTGSGGYSDYEIKSPLPYKNWGLWENDVVEFFIKREDSSLYLETQVSKHGDGFQLMIVEPRKIYYTPLDFQITTKSTFDHVEWRGYISVPKSSIPGSSNKFHGIVCAIIGKDKEYYSLNPNTGDEPDFHLLDLFCKFKLWER